jgi:hypothetical protein
MRGVARVWSNDLNSYRAMLRVIGNAREQGSARWWNDAMHDPMVPTLGLEDRKLIANAVTEDEWDKIVRAEDNIHLMESTRSFDRAATPADESGPALSDNKINALDEAIERIAEAVTVLHATARKQPVVAPDE